MKYIVQTAVRVYRYEMEVAEIVELGGPAELVEKAAEQGRGILNCGGLNKSPNYLGPKRPEWSID